jgi:diguanylate cyclase (GGDEF)-like protein
MLNQAIHLQISPSILPDSSATTNESKALDQEFGRYYVARSLPATRAAIILGIAVVMALCVLDVLTQPRALVEQAVPLRIMLMLVPMSLVLGATFFANRQAWLPYLIACGALLVGLSALVIGSMTVRTGATLSALGVILITFNIYLVLGLTLRQSVATAWPLFLAYVGVVFSSGVTPGEAAHGALFLGVSNLIGSYASFLLERNAREIFDNKRELMRLTRTDGLTGLFNRRAFDQHLRQLWKQARRDNKPIAVIVADIDHFKLYNDCYGHRMGDDCIKAVADTLAESVNRPLDIVARYGGEEYVIVLYDPTATFLESFARGLCRKVVTLDIEHKASETLQKVSLSIGGAITDAPDTLTADQLIRQADDALYEAKSQGRNRAVLYRTEWGQQTTADLAAVLT